MDTGHTYGIIGNGRVSRHFQTYFGMLGIDFIVWSRSSSTSAKEALSSCDIFLIAIKDDAISGFIDSHPFLSLKPCVHFSASVTHKDVQSMHPYFNFTDSNFSLETYQNIPFVTAKGPHTFQEIFPLLSNPNYTISPNDQAKYHALCVMTGNFPTMLWQETASSFEELGLPSDLSNAYIQNVATEFVLSPKNALTGPFSRGDNGTIENNISSLKNSRLEKIYTAFKDVFLK